MSRYIDAEWLKGEIRKAFPSLYMRVEINTLVNLAPSIDIVRCGECKWAKANGTYKWCGRLDSTARITADDYCSYGKRSEIPTGSEKPNNSKERSE